MDSSYTKLAVLQFFVMIYLTCHWTACLWRLVVNFELDEPPGDDDVAAAAAALACDDAAADGDDAAACGENGGAGLLIEGTIETSEGTWIYTHLVEAEAVGDSPKVRGRRTTAVFKSIRNNNPTTNDRRFQVNFKQQPNGERPPFSSQFETTTQMVTKLLRQHLLSPMNVDRLNPSSERFVRAECIQRDSNHRASGSYG